MYYVYACPDRMPRCLPFSPAMVLYRTKFNKLMVQIWTVVVCHLHEELTQASVAITGVVLKDSDEEVSEEEPIARQSQ